MIQRVLRHTNVRTQKHYRHADAQNLRGAVKGLGFGGEPNGPVVLPASPDAGPLPSVPGKASTAGPKLDRADVLEMRELRARGWTLPDLAKRFGVSKSTVHYALAGVYHKDDGTDG
jgi:hypothetical protein